MELNEELIGTHLNDIRGRECAQYSLNPAVTVVFPAVEDCLRPRGMTEREGKDSTADLGFAPTAATNKDAERQRRLLLRFCSRNPARVWSLTASKIEREEGRSPVIYARKEGRVRGGMVAGRGCPAGGKAGSRQNCGAGLGFWRYPRRVRKTRDERQFSKERKHPLMQHLSGNKPQPPQVWKF